MTIPGTDMARWLCLDCRYIGVEADFDRHKDPKSAAHWTVCPRCRTADNIRLVCDEPGCTRESSCGFPTDDGGYRHTCFEHSGMSPFTRLGRDYKYSPEINSGE